MAAEKYLVRVNVALLITLSIPCLAQIVTEPPAERLPPQLGNVGIEQRLNQQIPLALQFRDETGRTVRLREYFEEGRPVVLSLVYFRCRMLCDQVLSSLAGALRYVKFDAGKEFEVLTVSFDPAETPAMAAAAKQQYLAIYGHPDAQSGWHFLTGDQASIHALAEAVGFHYYHDPGSNQFAHATGIMLLTPDGRVSQYYYGAKYFPSDLRLGLIQSSENHIGTLADQIVLYCYHYDPRIGRYGAIVTRIIQVSGGATLLIFGSILLFLFWSDPNRKKRAETAVARSGDAMHALNPGQGD
ncbi:MAG TPA: SCO family protein [Terriglobales bacterium]|nr:SCO family protein [Terriglobales bacterium]